MFRRIRLTIHSGIATIVLAHPDKLNVLSRELLAELVLAFAQVRDTGARVLILTSEGRAFSSGGDLSDPATQLGELGALLQDAYHPALRALISMPIPVICGIRGLVVGGACGLVLACDVLIAEEDAVFDFAFARIGLVPDCGLAWLLPRIVGRNRARHLLLGGCQLGAAEAKSVGMVERVVAPGTLDATLAALGQSYANSPAPGMRLAKHLLAECETTSLDSALEAEIVAQNEAGLSSEFKAILARLSRAKGAFK